MGGVYAGQNPGSDRRDKAGKNPAKIRDVSLPDRFNYLQIRSLINSNTLLFAQTLVARTGV